MRRIILGAAILLAALDAAGAQTKPSGGQTAGQSSGPFSSDWARPFPQTGGYFYNDPRTQQQRPGNPSQVQPGGHPVCSVGTTYSPSSGRCR